MSQAEAPASALPPETRRANIGAPVSCCRAYRVIRVSRPNRSGCSTTSSSYTSISTVGLVGGTRLIVGSCQVREISICRSLLRCATRAAAIDAASRLRARRATASGRRQTNQTNHIFKVLTIFSVIFIPPTFIVGVYGTNFDVLPELHFPYSYFFMWGAILLLSILQLIFFRWKKWL